MFETDRLIAFMRFIDQLSEPELRQLDIRITIRRRQIGLELVRDAGHETAIKVAESIANGGAEKTDD